MIFTKKILTRKKLINSLIFFLIVILISTYIDFKKTNNQDLKRFLIQIKILDQEFFNNVSKENIEISISKILKNCINDKIRLPALSYTFSSYRLIFFSERKLGCEYHDYDELKFARIFKAEINDKLKKKNLVVSKLDKYYDLEVLSVIPIPKYNLYDPRPILIFVLMIALFYFLLKYHDEKD